LQYFTSIACHLTHTQLVGIGVLFAANDLANHDAAKFTGNAVNGVHFQPGHGNLLNQVCG
jgi:hypothetical protein